MHTVRPQNLLYFLQGDPFAAIHYLQREKTSQKLAKQDHPSEKTPGYNLIQSKFAFCPRLTEPGELEPSAVYFKCAHYVTLC